MVEVVKAKTCKQQATISSKLKNVHDRTFKHIFAKVAVARDFLANNLPAKLLILVDLANVELFKTNFVDEFYDERLADIVYKVPYIKNRTEYLYIILEHQSRPDIAMPIRMLRYSLVLIENLITNTKSKTKFKLPLIYSIVVYHGKKQPYPYATKVQQLFTETDLAQQFPITQFQLVDLTKKSLTDIAKDGRAAIFEIAQKHIFKTNTVEFLHAFKNDIHKLLSQKLFKLDDIWLDVIGYLVRARTSEEREVIIEMLDELLQIKGGKVNMKSIAESWLEEGWQKGMIEGEQLGIAKGEQLGIAKGEQLGIEKGKQELINNMLRQGIDLALIQKVSGLSQAKLSQLKEKLQ